MLTRGTTFVDPGQDYYERQYQDRVLKNLTQRAKEMGYRLVKQEDAPAQATAGP
jgi:hypothetical protein